MKATAMGNITQNTLTDLNVMEMHLHCVGYRMMETHQLESDMESLPDLKVFCEKDQIDMCSSIALGWH